MQQENNKDQQYYIVLSEIQVKYLKSLIDDNDACNNFTGNEHLENINQQLDSILYKINKTTH